MSSFVTPLTPLGFSLLMLEGQLSGRWKRARSEEGASAVEWVIIAAIVLSICLAISLVLKNALTRKANTIDTDLNAPN